MSMFKWEVVDPAPGEAVAPHQRLAWGKTVGFGAQHVVAMFGATFVFPLIMGLNPQLAIMMSGIATICFLLIVQGRCRAISAPRRPSSAVPPRSTLRAADRADRRRHRRDPGRRRGAGAVGVLIHSSAPAWSTRCCHRSVTGAVVMLIGFNLAPVAAKSTGRRTSGSRSSR